MRRSPGGSSFSVIRKGSRGLQESKRRRAPTSMGSPVSTAEHTAMEGELTLAGELTMPQVDDVILANQCHPNKSKDKKRAGKRGEWRRGLAPCLSQSLLSALR